MERLIGEKKRVVVVGGGVGGSMIAKTLQNDADVFLVDTKEYFEVPWAKLRAMVEPSFGKRIVINHSDYLPNAHIITSGATGITQNEVLTGQGRAIEYDYLVIATGHTHTGDFTRVERLRHFEAEQEKIKSSKSIVIVGGGPTGVELAGEICVDFPDKKVTLVHRGPRLLEFIGEKAGKKALNWLTSKKVEVILNQSVNLNSQPGGVYETSGGEKIVADCHFLCTGLGIGSSWLKETIFKDCLNREGQLKVDANLRVNGHPNVFAIGDITDIPELKLGFLTHNHALVAAKNLKLLMSGSKKPKLSTYSPGPAAAIVSLGRREGIMQFRCLTISGRIPGMMKSGDLFVTKTRKDRGLSS